MKINMLVPACALVATLPLFASEFRLDTDGAVRSGESGLSIAVSVPKAAWKGNYKLGNDKFKFPDPKTRRMAWSILGDKAAKAKGWTSLAAVAGGQAEIAANLTAETSFDVAGVYLTLNIPASRYAGCAFRLGAKKGTIPLKPAKGIALASAKDAAAFTLVRPDGTELTLTPNMPCSVLVQDSRKWGDNISVRFQTGGGTLAKGEKRAFRLTLGETGGVTATLAAPFVVSEGDEWLALDYRKDILAGTALDFSGMGLQDAPAGKYGWLKNVDGHFEFENLPGKVQRFYGVNLCFGANYPSHEETDLLVTRLVRLGYNAIRIHHFERDLIKGNKDRRTPNPEQFDRLDYLMAKSIEAGLYFTTDLYVSRPVAWEDLGITDGRKGVLENKNAYKALVAVNDAAFENYKAFARTFLLHENKYTGRRYVDEPAMPLISLINEGQITMGWSRAGGARDLPEMQAHWAKWLAGRRAADPAFGPEAAEEVSKQGTHAKNAAFAQFMADTERANATRIVAFLKDELKSRALFTDANCGPHFAPMQYVREQVYDYVDDHFYVDHPKFLVKPWSLPSGVGNKNPVLMEKLPPTTVAWTRTPGQPFCITEWNFSGPGQYRGVGGIMTGALSALQDWSGLWRFAYSHSIKDIHDGVGMPGYFNVATDPLGQAGDRASILLFLRRDLQPLERRLSLLVTPEAVAGQDGKAFSCAPAWSREAWYRQVSTTTDASRTRPGTEVLKLVDQALATKPPYATEGATGIQLDRTRGSFVLDTPRTSGGFTPDGSLACGTVSFTSLDGAATVWASSLDVQPLPSAKRILVTHLTDVQADGNVYTGPDKTVLLKWGKQRSLVRKGRADVRLALSAPAAYAVYALETSGKRLLKLPSRVEDGKLAFTADVACLPSATMLYEVVAE